MIEINNDEIVNGAYKIADLLGSFNDNQIEMLKTQAEQQKTIAEQQKTMEAQALEIHKLKESDANEKEKVREIVHQEVVDQLNDRSLPTESDVDNQIEEKVMDIVDDRITSHLEDHDVSYQVEEVLENKDYVTEHEAERIADDKVDNMDISGMLDYEGVAYKSDIEDIDIEGQVNTEVYDLFIRVLPLIGGEQHDETVRSYKRKGVDEYLKAQKEKKEEAEKIESAQLPPLPRIPAPEQQVS